MTFGAAYVDDLKKRIVVCENALRLAARTLAALPLGEVTDADLINCNRVLNEIDAVLRECLP